MASILVVKSGKGAHLWNAMTYTPESLMQVVANYHRSHLRSTIDGATPPNRRSDSHGTSVPNGRRQFIQTLDGVCGDVRQRSRQSVAASWIYSMMS